MDVTIVTDSYRYGMREGGMATCKHCGAEFTGGRSDQQFCDNHNKCKMAYWRKQQKKDQAEALADELEAVRVKVREQVHIIESQGQRLKDLEQEVTRLRALVDVEQRYHKDTQPRTLKAWLKKQPAHAIGELGQRLLADEFLPPRGSRSGYEQRLRSHNYSADDLAEFAHLWKLMLLQS